MNGSSRVTAGVIGLLVALGTAARSADEAAKKADAVKPPWQRLLRGDDAKKAKEQVKQLEQLQEAGRFDEALQTAQALAALRSRVQGADHWQTVNAQSQVEALRRVLRARKEDQTSYRRMLASHREATALLAKGRYREAQPLREQVLRIRRKVLGEEHPYTASGYNDMAANLYSQGKYQEAEEGFRKALAIFRKVLGEEHPNTANSYNNVAGNLNAQAKYKEAAEAHDKALAIWSKVLGEEHADTAEGYNNLAGDLYRQGKYKEAEEGFRKALAIRRKVLGEEDANTAISYNNVALSLNAQGKYTEAEEGYRKALAIHRKVLGEEHPYAAYGYGNLADNLNSQGKYTEAEEGFRKALALRRKALGEQHPNTATSYNALALNLNAQGKYQEAEEGLGKALAIRRKVLGEEHPNTANTYNDVAHNLNAQGKYQEAAEGYGKALTIYRKVLGEEHPNTATGYNNVAANLYAQGKYQEAEEGYDKALALRRKMLGEEHPQTAKSYYDVALNLNAQGKYVAAEKLWCLAADSFAKTRLHIAASGLERATITSKQSPLPALAAVLARNGKSSDAWQRFEESLARGTWDDLTARLRRPIAERDKQTQLITRIDRLNKLIEKTISAKQSIPEQSKRREELLTQLRQAQDELADFTRQLEKSYGPVAGQVFSIDKIRAALPADAALIGWLDIPGQAKAADPNGEHWAVLLRSSGEPIFVRLHGSGDKHAWTDDDTQLPSQLRTALQSPRGQWQPLAQRLRQQRLHPLVQHLKGVRRLIVLPSTALAGVPVEVLADGYTVSYAHSGSMYAHLRLQPASTGKGLFALADPIFDTPVLVEKTQPLPKSGVLVTVVVPGGNAAQAGLKPNDVLLRYNDADLGGPAGFKPQPESKDPKKLVPVVVWRDGKTFDKQLRPGKLGVVLAAEPAPQALAERRRWDRRLASRGGDDGQWQRLPGTRVEATSLRRLFDKDDPVSVLLDSEAGEQRLSELAQRGVLGKYRYLHLATHGEVNDIFPLRSAVILSRDQLPDEQQRTELLLSGQPIADGRLTAEEVLRRWNLHCDLVTLSACQTALGKFERGEGFVGFAQALILSGSRSVCLSLWKVDDTATALLMERFYQNLLGKRADLTAPLPKAAALAEAKEWLRKLPHTEAVKRAASLNEGVPRGKRPALPPLAVAPTTTETKDTPPYAHPYYWAAFVLLGHAE